MLPVECHTLFHAASQGDPIALNQLFHELRPYLRQHTHATVPPRLQARYDSSDIVQTTLEEAFVGLAQFGGLTLHEFWAWLTTIQQRNALDAITKNLRACRSVTAEVLLTNEHLGLAHEQPDQVAIAKEELERRMAALQRLRDDDQRIILLRRVEALTHAEIGQLFNIDEPTARKRYARAEARWIQELRRGVQGR